MMPVNAMGSLPLAGRDHLWDAVAAEKRVRAWASERRAGFHPGDGEIDWAKYGKAFAWHDPDHRTELGGYKLPFADIVDGELQAIPHAIFAAAAVLQGARGGVDIPEDDQAALRRNLSAEYRHMATAFNDPYLRAPWERTDAADDVRVARLDRGTMGTIERTPQGYLRVPGYATRVGVLTYRDRKTGQIVRELRPPEEVGKAESLATLRHVPITDRHPHVGLLDAQNTREFIRGTTGDTVAMDGDLVKLDCVIMDDPLIGKVERGEARELSTGYTCRVEKTPGSWRGQAYDQIQRDIVYNHLAVEPKGRAGPEVALRLDAAEEVADGEEEQKPMQKEKRKVGDQEYEMEPDCARAFDALVAKYDSDLTAATTRADAAEAKFDEAEAKIVKHERADAERQEKEKNQRQDADFHSAVNERIALVRSAEKVLPAETKFDALTDSEIKLAVIKELHPEAKMDGKSDDYVNARFDSAMEAVNAEVDGTGALNAASKQIPSGGQGSALKHRYDGVPSAEEARQRFIARKGLPAAGKKE